MICINDVRLLELSIHVDERGKLIALESEKEIPFLIKRIFYIFDSDTGLDTIRGKHANIKSSFVFISVSGSCKIKVYDQSGKTSIFELNSPNQALFVPAMIWKEMFSFSPNSVLLVLSDEKYDANEYINDYKDYCNKFKEMSK